MGKRIVVLVDVPHICTDGELVFVDYGVENVPIFAYRRHKFLRAIVAARRAVEDWDGGDVVRIEGH